MQILDILRESCPPAPWAQGDNIPWNEPGFSERMLREHLSQAHDLASRRREEVDRHVAWIHEHVLDGRTTRILDLCCGPGLYGARLAERGHAYVGIDYSPASIAHARRAGAADDRCTYIEGDIRRVEFGGGFGLVMMIYGEFNVFRPADASVILRKAGAALEPGGRLLLEPHTHKAVVSIGEAGRTWEALEAGLFSACPHLYLEQGHWDEAYQAATRQFFVIDAEMHEVARYSASYQAYSDEQYRRLLTDHGFQRVQFFPSLGTSPEPATSDLMVILAQKA
jgi:SAM-dependent methyltransferase